MKLHHGGEEHHNCGDDDVPLHHSQIFDQPMTAWLWIAIRSRDPQSCCRGREASRVEGYARSLTLITRESVCTTNLAGILLLGLQSNNRKK